MASFAAGLFEAGHHDRDAPLLVPPRRPKGETMSETAQARPQDRRSWIAPTLTRHESLAAMTQQYYPQQDPNMGQPGYPGDPNYPFGTFADSIPGSGGFFVG